MPALLTVPSPTSLPGMLAMRMAAPEWWVRTLVTAPASPPFRREFCSRPWVTRAEDALSLIHI
eukprot:10181428-Alexandrium_andersonii.AAC.1